MPRVPTAEESQRLRPSNPTGLPGTPSMGDAVKSFGQSMQALAEIEKRKNDADKKLDLARFKADYNQKLIEWDDTIKQNRHGQMAPVEYLKEQSDKWFESNIGNYRSDIRKDIDVAKTGLYSSQFKVTAFDQRALHSSKMKQNMDEVIMNTYSKVKNNPQLLDSALQGITDDMAPVFKSIYGDPAFVRSKMDGMYKDMIGLAVEKYSSMGKGQEAKAVLDKYATRFAPDEYMKQMNAIEGNITSYERAIEAKEEKAKKLQEESRKIFADEFLQKAVFLYETAQSGEDLVAADKILADFTAKKESKLTDVKAMKALSVEARKRVSKVSGAYLSAMLSGDEPVRAIKDKANEFYVDKELTEEDYKSWITALDKRENIRQQVDPTLFKEFKDVVTEGVKNHALVKSLDEGVWKPAVQQAEAAYAEYIASGMNYTTAAYKAIGDYTAGKGGSPSFAYVKGLPLEPQRSEEGIKALAKGIAVKMKESKDPAKIEEYKKQLTLLGLRLRDIKRQEQVKEDIKDKRNK